MTPRDPWGAGHADPVERARNPPEIAMGNVEAETGDDPERRQDEDGRDAEAPLDTAELEA